MGLSKLVKNIFSGLKIKHSNTNDSLSLLKEENNASFEFLIVGEIDVFTDYDAIMTPNSLEWVKIKKEGWDYYRVGTDEFTYSFEPPGIQMIFNKEMQFEKAKIIADEIISNINATGQKAELIILDEKNLDYFDT